MKIAANTQLHVACTHTTTPNHKAANAQQASLPAKTDADGGAEAAVTKPALPDGRGSRLSTVA